MKTWKLLTFIILLLLVGCRQQAATPADTGLQIDVRLDPEEPVVGESKVIVTVHDASGQPVNNASVTVRGDMNHAGMVPIIEVVESGTDGEYVLPLEWTMAGDWIIEVTVELPSGEMDSVTVDLLVER